MIIDGGIKIESDGGKKVEPDGGKKVEPDGGKKVEPDGGKKTTPDGGKKTEPDGGKKTTPDGGKKTEPDAGKKTTNGSAQIEVSLPQAAQLVIDDYTVPHVSDRHVYITSPLTAGETRTITFKSQNVTKQVTVTAGQTLQVSLNQEGVASR